uniref:Uncharacterized protein n=1 Tax=Arundo donax TaxID=35708 RepID=A0A0A9F3M1_ARUDO
METRKKRIGPDSVPSFLEGMKCGQGECCNSW